MLLAGVMVRRPLVWMAGSLAAGVVAGGGEWFSVVGVPTAIGLLGLLAVLAASQRVASVAVLPIAFAVTGSVMARLDEPPTETLSRHVGWSASPLLLEGRVVTAPERRPSGHRLLFDLIGAAPEPTAPLVSATGRVRLTVHTGSPCGAPGDRIRIWARVRRPRGLAFPGGFAAAEWARREGIALFASAASSADCVRVARAERSGWTTLFERVRDEIHQAIGEVLTGPEAAVVRALATGDRSGISPEVRTHFQRSGLSHLLAISGLHLAIVSGIFMTGLKQVFLRFDRIALGLGAHRVAAGCALPMVAGYTMLVGASPSAIRAAVMVASVLVGQLVGRAREPYSALALAAVGLLVFDPRVLGDVSFQLSFLAVLALLRAESFMAALRRRASPGGVEVVGRWRAVFRSAAFSVLGVLGASAAATAGTAPLVAHHFGRLSLVGVLANVPAAPLASIGLVPLALIGGTLALLSETLAAPILELAAGASRMLVAIAAVAGSLPGASVVVSRPSGVETVLFYGVLLALSSPRPLRRRRWVLGLAGVLVVAIGVTTAVRHLSTRLEVTFLPVGQGDAAVVELPYGRTVLIDSGPPETGRGRGAVERVVLPFLRHRRISRLDLLVLSHPHADHIGGLAALAQDVAIGEVWWSGDRREGSDELLAPLEGLKTRRVRAGATWSSGVAELVVQSPDLAPVRYPTVNDASVVVELRMGRRRIWLMGDAEQFAEGRLAHPPVRADVLKVGHHGSRTSSTEAFLRALGPAHAVISCGVNNRFGFPHSEVLGRLDRLGVTVWRTDRDGAVTVWTDGDAMTVRGFIRSGRAPPSVTSTHFAPGG